MSVSDTEDKCKERADGFRRRGQELCAVAEEKRLALVMWLAHEVLPELEGKEPEETDAPCLPNKDALDQMLEVPVDELCKLASSLLLHYQIPALGGDPTEKAVAEAVLWLSKVHSTVSLLMATSFGIFIPHPSLMQDLVCWKLYRYLYCFYVIGEQLTYN